MRAIFGSERPRREATFAAAHQSTAFERAQLVKAGLPARAVDVVANAMDMPKSRLASTLGLARATVDRKARENKRLSADESSRLLGVTRLVGQVQTMLAESGDPQAVDAARWVAGWLEQPLAALGGRRPAELMDTAEGQSVVADMVGRMQSGAYA